MIKPLPVYKRVFFVAICAALITVFGFTKSEAQQTYLAGTGLKNVTVGQAAYMFNSGNGDSQIKSPQRLYKVSNAVTPIFNSKTIAVTSADSTQTKHYVAQLTRAPILAPAFTYNAAKYYRLNRAIAPLAPTVSINADAPAYSSTRTVLLSGLDSRSNGATTTDTAGNLYVISFFDNAVRKFTPSGVMTTIDNSLYRPVDIAADVAGNLYVADYGNRRIRKIPANGGPSLTIDSGIQATAITVDGNGMVYYAGLNDQLESVPANGGVRVTKDASIQYSRGLVADNAGNVYMSDVYNAIYKYPAGGGPKQTIVTNVPGAYLIKADAAGDVYFIQSFAPNYNSYVLKKMSAADYSITTVIDGLPDINKATIDNQGNFFFVQKSTNANIEKIVPVGGFYSGNLPLGLLMNSSTGVITGTPKVVTPLTNYKVTAYAADGVRTETVAIAVTDLVPEITYKTPHTFKRNVAITPVAPTAAYVGALGYGNPVSFGNPATATGGFEKDKQGNAFVLDLGQKKIFKYAPNSTVAVEVVTGTNPTAITVDEAGNLYVFDQASKTVIKVAVGSGAITTIASDLVLVRNMCVAKDGTIYAADAGRGNIKQIPAGGGTPVVIEGGFSNPSDVDVDADGNIYVADQYNNVIKKVWLSTDGHIETLYSGNTISCLAVDNSHNVFAIDLQTGRLFMIPADGSAQIRVASGSDYLNVNSLFVDDQGLIYFTSFYNTSRLIKPTGGIFIDRELPTGLKLNNTTGEISGTPTTLSATSSYKVTAFNSYGESQPAVVSISVFDLAPYAGLDLKLHSGTSLLIPTTGTDNYTTSVAPYVTSVTFTPTAQDSNAVIKLNGNVVPSGVLTSPVRLNQGTTTVTFEVTAQDGVNVKTYTVTVSRLGSNNSVVSFELSPVSTLVPTTGPAMDNYVTSVGWRANSSVTITPTAQEKGAVIRLNGNIIQNKVASPPVPLGTDPTMLNVTVTAADSTTIRTYSIKIFRNGSSNALARFELSPTATLVPTTGAASTNYKISVPPSTTSIDVTTITDELYTYIMQNGDIVGAGILTQTVPLNDTGATVVNYSILADDLRTTKTYSITIYRNGSNVALVKSFRLDPTSALIKTTGPADADYVTSVSPELSSIRLETTAQQADAVIRVNDVVVASGEYSAPIILNAGATVINVSVTAGDGVTVKTFAITVSRTGSNNASVEGFRLNPASVITKTTTGPADANYVTAVTPELSSIRLQTTAQQANAVIRVNGIVVASGEYSAPIFLDAGATVINVSVTAQDGITVKTFAITVNRVGSNNALVESFRLDPASVITKTTGPADANYVTSVTPELSSVRLQTTAQQANAVIRINGEVVVSGEYSAPIILDAGATVINVSLTAQDGVTVKTFAITVNRVGSNNALVKTFRLDPASTLIKTTGPADANYVTSVPYDLSSIRLETTVQQANAVIRVNGEVIASGVYSGPIPLNAGATVINVLVTAQDGVTVKTLAIKVNRTGSNNALVKSFRLNPASVINKTTGPADANYITSVSPALSSIRLQTIAQQANAIIRVNGEVVASGEYSAPITLNAGATVINVSVTAQDGVTVKTHLITVNRLTNFSAVNKNDRDLLYDNKSNNSLAIADDVVVHPAVSPNGDGLNDYLVIEGLSDHPGNKLSIMNATGALVFEIGDYGKDGANLFNGQSKSGVRLKPGTYYYQLEYNVNKVDKRKRGYIIIKY